MAQSFRKTAFAPSDKATSDYTPNFDGETDDTHISDDRETKPIVTITHAVTKDDTTVSICFLQECARKTCLSTV
jgi:hypothetical protein